MGPGYPLGVALCQLGEGTMQSECRQSSSPFNVNIPSVYGYLESYLTYGELLVGLLERKLKLKTIYVAFLMMSISPMFFILMKVHFSIIYLVHHALVLYLK